MQGRGGGRRGSRWTRRGGEAGGGGGAGERPGGRLWRGGKCGQRTQEVGKGQGRLHDLAGCSFSTAACVAPIPCLLPISLCEDASHSPLLCAYFDMPLTQTAQLI